MEVSRSYERRLLALKSRLMRYERLSRSVLRRYWDGKAPHYDKLEGYGALALEMRQTYRALRRGALRLSLPWSELLLSTLQKIEVIYGGEALYLSHDYWSALTEEEKHHLCTFGTLETLLTDTESMVTM